MNLKKMKLAELYYLLLVNKIHDGLDIISFDNEEIYKEINERYKEENGEYLEDNSKILEWVRDRCRYSLLNMLLVRLFDRFINVEKIGDYEIDNTDFFFINNIHAMNKMMEDEAIIAYNSLDYNTFKYHSKIDKWKVIDCVKDILLEIDNTSCWCELYEKAINDKIIIYLNELSEEEIELFKKKNGIDISLDGVKNACLFNDNGLNYILLTYEGEVSDIYKTVHEIIHYIVRQYNGNKKERNIFRELPSMFYEMYALRYLSGMGYFGEELKKDKVIRYIDTYNSYTDSDALMNYLKIIIDKGHVSLSDIMNEYNSYLNKRIEYFDGEVDSEDYNYRCDKCTCDLIDNQYMLFGYYPYLIDNYLADKAIMKIDSDKYIMDFMKYITEHINEVSKEDVFNIILDGKIDLYEEDKKVKVRDK